MKLRFYERSVYEIKSVNHKAWDTVTEKSPLKNVGYGDTRMDIAYDVMHVIADDPEEALATFREYFATEGEPLIVVSIRLVGYSVEKAAPEDEAA